MIHTGFSRSYCVPLKTHDARSSVGTLGCFEVLQFIVNDFPLSTENFDFTQMKANLTVNDENMIIIYNIKTT